MSTMAANGGKRPRRQFSEEFRAQAVRLVLDEGKTVGAVAREHDVTASALATYNPARFLAADHYGGFVVGIVVEMSTLVLPSELKVVSGLVILIVMLLVRPQGIFGTRERIG